MIMDRMLNQDETPMLERALKFTEDRQNVLADDIANATTPGYEQKDLSLTDFEAQLRDRLAARESAGAGEVRFDDITTDVQDPRSGILFHDGNNRSMEQLMTDNAKNALMHNLVVELLREQYTGLEAALKEKVS